MTKAEMRAEVDTLLIAVGDIRDRLQALREELHNRSPQTRGERTSKPITPRRRQLIRDLHVAYPELPQHEIARMADTNQGRVSETLAGKRT